MFNLLYQQDDFPIFQNRMYNSKKEGVHCPKGNICLVEDLKTGLIYNASFSPDLMVYDRNYQNEQGISRIFQDHLEVVAGIIERSIGKERLVEIGCGKGFFLEILINKGFDITGFDPTYEGLNPCIKQQYFGPNVIKKSNGLILRHVLEHIQHPVSFLEQLKIANYGNGKIYIEVPCFDWICEHKAWFDIFYEHVNYFRLTDFNRMFGEVIESGKLFGGQYIYVIAELSSLKTPILDSNDQVNFPSDFTASISEKNSTQNNRIAIWGGASKGVIFALLKIRAGYEISTVIDINPAKQGKFLAGTGLQIKSASQGLLDIESGSTIYIMNSNYLEEIKNMSNDSFNYIEIDHE